MECASVARAPDGGLQTRDVKGDVVEEVRCDPSCGVQGLGIRAQGSGFRFYF